MANESLGRWAVTAVADREWLHSEMGSDILERYLLTAHRKMVCDSLLHVNRALVEEECNNLFPTAVYKHM
jgi:hypothetical protein